MATGFFHRGDRPGRRTPRTVAVEKNMRRDSGAAAFGKSPRQVMRDRTILVQVLRKRDRRPGGSDVAQHRRKGFVAVEQNFDAVAADDRRIGIGLDGWEKRRFAERDLGYFAHRQHGGAADK